ncbi:MAG: cyclic nucleotide-binding domain-containing protein, partial [Elusimicrobia bacterium]|nr:cyclic nucleotide-binding domain-containing protein [Elusimicrobiota bacterium]
METIEQSQKTWAEAFLQKIPLFEKGSPQDIHNLSLSMRKHTYEKGDTILFQGIISHQLYLIAKGSVTVYSRKDKVTRLIASLNEGDYFGEISLVKSCAATATIKAATIGTEIWTIDYEAILNVLKSHPEARADMEEKIRLRNKNRLEVFEKEKEKDALPAPSLAVPST